MDLTLSGQEIGLHHKNYVRFANGTPAIVKAQYEAEMLNRERTWFGCVGLPD